MVVGVDQAAARLTNQMWSSPDVAERCLILWGLLIAGKNPLTISSHCQ